MNETTLDLFGNTGRGDHAQPRAVETPAQVSRGADRGVLLDGARYGSGPYWPRYEVQRITTLATHRERAQAFAAIPPEFQLMAARLLHRWYWQESPIV